MYISGENIVVKPYTPVDAYAVMPMAGGDHLRWKRR